MDMRYTPYGKFKKHVCIVYKAIERRKILSYEKYKKKKTRQ